MKTNLKVHFSSKTDQWATPQNFFDGLNAEFGGFELDVCADKSNTKCSVYFDKNDDGLKKDWAHFGPGTLCWMNPPYGREISKWVAKAAAEAKLGCHVVALLPSRTDTRWFHDHIYQKDRVAVRFLKGRLKFGGASNSAPFPSMLVIFEPHLPENV